jgi:hypothetical protein
LGWCYEGKADQLASRRGKSHCKIFDLDRSMGLSKEDREVATAKESIMNIGVVPALLDLQNEDGPWARPERFYTDKYRGTV